MSIHDRNKLKRLRRYSSRLNRMIEDGSFESLPSRKRDKLLDRVRSLYDGLSGVISDVALRHILAAAAVLVLGVSACGGGNGQAGDADAEVSTDTIAEMDAADLSDPADDPELEPDAAPDADDDPVPDAEEDPEEDPELDPEEDAEEDPGLDPEEDPATEPATDVEDDAPTLTPSFATAARNHFGLSPARSMIGLPELADLDGDGDEDLLTVAFDGYSAGSLSYHENTGTATSPAFGSGTTNPFGITVSGWIAAAALADLDDDGDLDLLMGEASPYSLAITYQENTGTATAPAFGTPVTAPFGITGLTSEAVFPELADIDADGDLDLFTGNVYGEIRFYRNTGTASSPAFATPVLNPFGSTTTYELAAPALTDLDRDGDLDMLVGQSDYYGDSFQYFENTGTATSPAFAAPVADPFGLAAVSYLAFPDFSDIDDDGDMDLFVGEYYGDIIFFRNTSI